MAEKKSIIAEALLDIKNIQNALNANTKEILRSVAREEIDSVVKESLMKDEAVYEEEDLDAPEETGTDLGVDADASMAGVETDELGGEESGLDDLSDIEDSEEVAPELEPEMDLEVEPEIGMDSDELGGEMDMTASSDDDIIAIYKKLSGDDEVEIVGDEIHLNITEPGQYVVKTNQLGGGEESTEDFIEDLEPMDGEESEEEEEGGLDYEIEMGDDEEGESEEHEAGESAEFEAGEEEAEEEAEEEEEEEELEELEETKYVGGKVKYVGSSHDNAKLEKESVNESAKKLVSETAKKYNTLLTEAKKLKNENDEFRKALKVFRNQLVETVVFNSNLTYTTRLFMEHSTTKTEKQNIIKRFDNEVSNLIESKKLYKTIVHELESRKPVNESVENKIIKEVTTSVSKQLNESTAYVDPSTKRIIDLMKRVENKNNNN